MEIKVNDYVRTKKGIKKIYKIDSNKTKWKYLFKLKEQDGDGCIDLGCLCDEDIIKSSPNITDLIEKKDIVVDYNDNIYQVTKVFKDYVFTDKKNKYGQVITLVDYQIKGIVTKEMFEQMEYKIN